MAIKYISDIFSPEILAWFRQNPKDYIRDVILNPKSELDNKEYGWTHQQEEMLDCLPHNKMITIRSGKGVGKTAFVAWIAQWFVSVFDHPKVFISAPSSGQINSALMPEIKRWLSGSLVQPIFTSISKKIYYPHDDTGHTFIEARTAQKDNPDAMSGMHAENMLIIVDEASGVDDEILTRLIDTCTQKNNIIIFISNPTKNNGIYWETHNRDISNQWTKLHFSAVDSPRVPDAKIQAQISNWGKNSDIVRVGVYGEFPKEDPDSFLPYSGVASMFGREINIMGNEDVEIGLDVARQGDDRTVWFWRQGNKVHEPVFKGKTDGPEVVEGTLELVRKIRRETLYEGVIRIKIDDVGVGGFAGDFLKRDTEHNIEVVPCIANGKGDETYANEASMMWGQVRNLLDMISLPNEADAQNPQPLRLLREELSARRVDFRTGKVKLESKDNFKKEFNRSPDFADAFVMMFFKKRGELSAVKNFNPSNEFNVIKRPNYRSSYDRYAGLYYSDFGLTSFLVAHWGNGELIVMDEYEDQVNTIEMASIIVNSSPGGYKRIIANKNCFGGTGQNTIQRQLKRHGVKIKEDKKYDLYGSVQLLNQLVDDGRFKVLRKNKGILESLFEWRLDGNTMEQKSRFGLCIALTHIVSYLRKEIENPTLSHPMYSGYVSEQENDRGKTLKEIHEGSLI